MAIIRSRTVLTRSGIGRSSRQSAASRPSLLAVSATAWISEPNEVATLPARGPVNRFSIIQQTGHPQMLSTADGDNVAIRGTDDWPVPSAALSGSGAAARDPTVREPEDASSTSSRNGQRVMSAASTPLFASSRSAFTAS